jgi:hypothetical protein
MDSAMRFDPVFHNPDKTQEDEFAIVRALADCGVRTFCAFIAVRDRREIANRASNLIGVRGIHGE